MRQPSLERIAEEIKLVGARESLDQEVTHAGNQRAPLLDAEPLVDGLGQVWPVLWLGQQTANAVGEIGRERKLAAVVGRDLGVFRGGARDIDLVLDQRLVFEDFAGEHEGIARHQHFDEILLDLAEHTAAARDRAGMTAAAGARAHQADLQHVGLTMVPTFMR
jgi:hypothetical protein